MFLDVYPVLIVKVLTEHRHTLLQSRMRVH